MKCPCGTNKNTEAYKIFNQKFLVPIV